MAPIFTGRFFGFGPAPSDGPPPLTVTGGTELTPGNGYKYHVFTEPNNPKYAPGGGAKMA